MCIKENILLPLISVLLLKVGAFADPSGAGSATTGGRGQVIYEITNTNDSGAGSLRECFENSNRQCVFRTCGEFSINTSLESIGDSNVTIWGQSAPCPVTITAENITISAPEKGHATYVFNSDNLRWHNFAVVYKKNTNYTNYTHEQCCDVMTIEGTNPNIPENIHIENVGLYGGNDEIFSAISPSGITLKNSILAFGLKFRAGHFDACAIIAAADPGNAAYSFTSDKNLLMCWRRNIEGKIIEVEQINNWVVATQKSYPNILWPGGGQFDLINNVFESISIGGKAVRHLANTGSSGISRGIGASPNLFFQGNIFKGKHYSNQSELITFWDNSENPYIEHNIDIYDTSTRLGLTAVTEVLRAAEVKQHILDNAGASFRIDGVGQKVSIDNNFGSLAKAYAQNPETAKIYIDGSTFPDIVQTSGTAYTDTDSDGMADDWEDNIGLNVGVADHNGTDLTGGPKTNIECFMMDNCPQTLNYLYLASANENGTFTEDNSEIYLPSQLSSAIDDQYGIVKTTSSEGYTVVTDKERFFFAARPNTTGYMNVLSCPHRFHDTYTGDICLEIFKESTKVDAVIISTTHRYDCANPTNCDDSSGTTPSGCDSALCDMARNEDSIFHHFVRYYLQNNFNMYQFHGFGAAQSFTGIGTKAGQTLNIILASGFSEEEIPTSVSTRLASLESAFETAYPTQITGHCYGTAEDLCATVNTVNNDTTITDDEQSNFVHIEFKRNVRDEICSDTLDSACPVTDATGQTNRAKVIEALGL